MSKPGSKVSAAPKTAAAAPKTTPVTAAAAADAKAAEAEVKVPLAKMRGPRGVAETAKISLLVPSNPKRVGSKAFAVFSCYKDGMTVGEFCDAVDATANKGEATPNLVYDAAHKFIAIEGYTPGQYFEPKPKAPAAPKVPKAPKSATAPKTPEQAKEEAESHAAEVGESTETETME